MAFASAENKVETSSSLLDNINTLNVFGKCKKDDLVYIKNEKKDRENQFKKARSECKKERKRQEKLRNEQEIADREFLNEEQEFSKPKRTVAYNVPQKSCGRGNFLSGEVVVENKQHPVQKAINQFVPNYHSNSVTLQYLMDMGLDQDEESDCSIEDNNSCYTPDSSSNPDQFEDAEDSQQSTSALSYFSVPSQASTSPTLLPSTQMESAAASNDTPMEAQPFVEVPSTSTSPRKPRRSRIAARFSNLDESNTEQEQDPLAVLGSSQTSLAPIGLRTGFMNTGSSINHLRPSQRILSNNVLQPKDLFNHDYATNSCPSSGYIFNVQDFPPL